MIATGGRREAKSPARNPCRPHSIRVRACAVPVVGYGVFAIATEYSHGWTWRREKKKAWPGEEAPLCCPSLERVCSLRRLANER